MTAIYCETCDQYFHLPCFELNTSEEIEEDDACIYIESGILHSFNYFMILLDKEVSKEVQMLLNCLSRTNLFVAFL